MNTLRSTLFKRLPPRRIEFTKTNESRYYPCKYATGGLSFA